MSRRAIPINLLTSNLYVKMLLMNLRIRPTGCHLLYGITQCYLQPDTNEHTPARLAGTRFTYSGGMEGRVDLGDWLHTEMVYSHTDGHCIQVA